MTDESSDAPPQTSSPEPLPNSWVMVGIGFAVCAAAAVLCVLVLNQYLKTRPLNLRDNTLALADDVDQLLRANRVYPENIRRSEPRLVSDERASWLLTQFEVDIDGPDPAGIEAVLEREMRRQDVTLTRGEVTDTVREMSLALGGCAFADIRLNVPQPEVETPPPGDEPAFFELLALAGLVHLDVLKVEEGPAFPQEPKVAIILDDAGYGGSVTDAALELDPGLTIAVLPGAPYAAETARRAAEAGFQVMLHLPMESPEDPGWISTSTPPEEMRRLIDEALERVPGAAGINNHMGSVFSASDEALARLFDILKDRPLFFIDSRTTHETRIPEFARQAGVPVGARKVFLDNEGHLERIREQFDQLVDSAKQDGSAIGIGHVRPATVEALKVLLPELKTRGICLVHASELAL